MGADEGMYNVEKSIELFQKSGQKEKQIKEVYVEENEHEHDRMN